VLDAAVGQSQLPDGRIAATGVLERLARGEPLQVRLEAGPDRGAAAAFFALAGQDEGHHVILVAREEDLVFFRHSRAGKLGFQEPWRAVDDLLARASPGDTAQLTLRGDRFTLESAGVRATGDGRLPVSRGWSFLFSSPLIGWTLAQSLDVLWILILTLPAGVVAVGGRAAGTMAALAALAISVIPLLFPSAAGAGPMAIAAAPAGILVGSLVRRWGLSGPMASA
jgi:hypothetical protein